MGTIRIDTAGTLRGREGRASWILADGVVPANPPYTLYTLLEVGVFGQGSCGFFAGF